MQIPFLVPTVTGDERAALEALLSRQPGGRDRAFSDACETKLAELSGTARVFGAPSCSAALELAALALGIAPGDEVIVPSFTFSSTANAFALRGARIVFADVRPDTMNLDETRLEALITPRTRVIVPVHYAGVGCDMDAIMAIANRHRLFVVEDAAQAIGARYKGRVLGTIGHMGAVSFHYTKNLQCGEGGALFVRDDEMVRKVEILRENGTDRASFLRGEVDAYRWHAVGTNCRLSDVAAAHLLPQLERIDEIHSLRLERWHDYQQRLSPEGVEVMRPPAECEHNAHIFFLKVQGDAAERNRWLRLLREHGVSATFHYVPLHSAPAGLSVGAMGGEDLHTTRESGRLIRLPLFHGLSAGQVDRVCDLVLALHRGAL